MNSPTSTTNIIPRIRGVNWSRAEDVALVRGWLNTSQDPAVGTGQKANTFWSRVCENASDAFREDNPQAEACDRGHRSSMARFSVVQAACMKYKGYLRKAGATKGNGEVAAGVDGNARRLYSDGEGRAFISDRCWEVLKDAPKWQECCMQRERPALEARRSSSASFVGRITDAREDSEDSLNRPEESRAAKRLDPSVAAPDRNQEISAQGLAVSKLCSVCARRQPQELYKRLVKEINPTMYIFPTSLPSSQQPLFQGAFSKLKISNLQKWSPLSNLQIGNWESSIGSLGHVK